MELIRTVYLAANKNASLIAPDKYIYPLDGDGNASLIPMKEGDIVIYDPRFNRTVGPGVTYKDVPKLGIAMAIDTDGDGMADKLRTVFGGHIDGCSGLKNVTTEPPKCGCNPIMKVLFKCTPEDKYSLTVETRSDKTLQFNPDGRWDQWTATVNMESILSNCDTCTDGTVPPSEVACALANEFNKNGKNLSAKKNGIWIKKALKLQNTKRDFIVYPLYANMYEYKFTMTSSDACKSCNQFDSVGGIKILGIGQGGADVTVTFSQTTVEGDTAHSLNSQKTRIVNLINKAFKDNNVGGYAFWEEQMEGSGAPCCSPKLRLNSCKEVALIDGAGVDITPFKNKYDPIDITVTKDAECVGCGTNSTWKPDAGLIFVPKPLKINCSACDMGNPDRKVFYHTDIRVHQGFSDTFRPLYVVEEAKAVIPQNLGVQLQKCMLDMDNGGTGGDYEAWTNENVGLYQRPNKGMAGTEAVKGVDCKAMYCTIIFEQDLNYSVGVNTSRGRAKGMSVLAIDNDNTTIYNAIKAVLDGWLASVPCGSFGPILCTTDVDQVEAIYDPDTNVLDTVSESPNDPLHEVDPKGGDDKGA